MKQALVFQDDLAKGESAMAKWLENYVVNTRISCFEFFRVCSCCSASHWRHCTPIAPSDIGRTEYPSFTKAHTHTHTHSLSLSGYSYIIHSHVVVYTLCASALPLPPQTRPVACDLSCSYLSTTHSLHFQRPAFFHSQCVLGRCRLRAWVLQRECYWHSRRTVSRSYPTRSQ